MLNKNGLKDFKCEQTFSFDVEEYLSKCFSSIPLKVVFNQKEMSAQLKIGLDF